MLFYIVTLFIGVGLAIYSNINLKVASGFQQKKYAQMWNTSLVVMSSSILGFTSHIAFSKVYDDDLVFIRSLGPAILMAILLTYMITLVFKYNAHARKKMEALYDLRGVVVKSTDGRVQKVRLYRDEDTITVNAFSGDVFKNGDHVLVLYAMAPKHVRVMPLNVLNQSEAVL